MIFFNQFHQTIINCSKQNLHYIIVDGSVKNRNLPRNKQKNPGAVWFWLAVSVTSRRCYFLQCKRKLPLYTLPQEDEVKEQWLNSFSLLFLSSTTPTAYSAHSFYRELLPEAVQCWIFAVVSPERRVSSHFAGKIWRVMSECALLYFYCCYSAELLV